MGTWGFQTFEGDSDCDYLGTLVQQIKRSIDKELAAMAKEVATGKIGRLDRTVVAAVAILSALAQKIPYTRHTVCKGEVRRWQDAYFAWFDRAMVSEQHSRKFQENAKKEFLRLLRLAYDENAE